ncbi:hypothetical protein CI109_104226 [Kwoniella shandongensis]|uniref:Protein kinase domain-containing protein n=1 Tax=Kwoniella shandongensis TaxID=1734106 RepID=A0AAJ8LL58_9TREE
MNPQPPQAGPSNNAYRRQSLYDGYSEDVIQPAYPSWSDLNSPQRQSEITSQLSPSHTLQPPQFSPQRERLASSASISSMSSTVRGRRAPAPAALDLSPRSENRYGGLGLGQGGESRRIVTEPTRRSSRPLPHPPSHPPLAPAFVAPIPSDRRQSTLMAEEDTRASSYYLNSAPHSPPEPSHSASTSPLQPDPSNIDRRALIGVGELATPRWGATTNHQHLRTPSMPFNLGSSPPVPSMSHAQWASSQEGFGLGFDRETRPQSESNTDVPPRPPTKSPAREKPRELIGAPNTTAKDDSLFSLNSLADFNFDTSMEAALAASLSMATLETSEPNSPPAPLSPPTANSPISPGSARSRIYARRQERAAAAAAAAAGHLPQPPTSADPQSATYRAARDSRKTPPNPSRHSTSHDILKQFAVKDFSHLPPSPSSASINQFLRGSGSVNNFSSSTPPSSASAANSSFTIKPQQNDAQRLKTTPSNPKISRDVDPNTAEALRKLDGLTGTPGKVRSRTKSSSGTPGAVSRPSSPSDGKLRPKITSKASSGSLKDSDSPLNNWVDIGEDLPPVPVPRRNAAKRESSSSASYVGTPTSRDSHSLPTTSTTPSSGDGISKPRRSSGGSDMSSPGMNLADLPDQDPGIVVPPVPPLPKGYMSMRQGLNAASFAPVRDPSPHSPALATSPLAPPKMHKKWSFSSALNLKSNSSPVPSVEDGHHSPQTAWSEIHQGDLLSPGLQSHDSSESVPQSITPVATGKSAAAATKRLTPSSIPFFRRTSSSSTQTKQAAIQVPETPKSADHRGAPGSQSRKSVLGMHLPSMLRSSNSKRGLSQQLNPPPKVVEMQVEQPASTGWTGRKRGKPTAVLKHQSSFERSLGSRSSATSSRSESTVNGATEQRLPAIAGSPARTSGNLRHSGSSRDLPSVTPTKIPRMASRPGMPSPATIAMPPPSFSSARSKTLGSTSSMAELSRAPVNEFGVVETSNPRQSTSGAHRAHLLAPMSTRQETKRMMSRPIDPPARRDPAPGIPPSRRQLPRPPSSTVTALTVSAAAKRTSRDLKVDRRDTKETSQDGTSSGRNSPIKPSKSLHSKLSIPSTSKMSTSSSVGAPGTSFRKASLAAESPSISPADDEESLADAEMAAYIKRRRQRALTSKKDDLSDVNEFPEDIPPAEPVSQRAFVSRSLATMSDLERKEVLDFDLIYYSPPPNSVKRPLQASGASYNHGYDDERGDYLVVEGDHLCYRYEVVGILGKGSFGQVVQCRDHKTGVSVAVKIIRNKKRFHAQALVEVKILQQLVEWVSSSCCWCADEFAGSGGQAAHGSDDRSLLLPKSLVHSHRTVEHQPVRAHQGQSVCGLFNSLDTEIYRSDASLVTAHAVSSDRTLRYETRVYTYIQSRFYRSPEVILGMNYAMAIDMWSVGRKLFFGKSSHIWSTLTSDATGSPRPFVNAKGRRRRPGTKTLAAVLKCDDELFVDFIAKCLTWDPDKRLKPQPALRHPWILSGKKRYAPTPSREERRPTERSASLLSNPATSIRASAKTFGEFGTSNGGKDKSKLLISPPTPLMARQSHHAVTASVPKIGQSISSSRLTYQSSARTNSYSVSDPCARLELTSQSAPKVSIG